MPLARKVGRDPMSRLCDGRVVIVTGAGRGIGRGYALEFARQGAKVVVNDLGADAHGSGHSVTPAGEVVEAIRAEGGEAIANGEDISDWEGSQRLVQAAVDTFGGLDVLVNNAGILRDRMLVNMTIEDWDAVVKVHLRGTFATSHWAANYWRERSKQGETNDARIINTTSSSGLYGNVGQANYGAAKAGIAGLTIISSMELARYGVTVNAIAPGALTRMTENLGSNSLGASQGESESEDAFDRRDPNNIAPLAAWLGSPESAKISGRIFYATGGRIAVVEGWHLGPEVENSRRWDPEELGSIIPDLVAAAAPNAQQNGRLPGSGSAQ